MFTRCNSTHTSHWKIHFQCHEVLDKRLPGADPVSNSVTSSRQPLATLRVPLHGAAYLYQVSALPCLLAAGTVPTGVARILLLRFVFPSPESPCSNVSPLVRALSFIFNLSATLLSQHTLFPGTYPPPCSLLAYCNPTPAS